MKVLLHYPVYNRQNLKNITFKQIDLKITKTVVLIKLCIETKKNKQRNIKKT